MECHDLFYGEIERQYPLAYELAKIGLQELGRLLNRCVPTVEFGYLALYFELALMIHLTNLFNDTWLRNEWQSKNSFRGISKYSYDLSIIRELKVTERISRKWLLI